MTDPREELDEELQFHLDRRIQDYIARGMTPEDARAAAAARFGDLARVRRNCTSLIAAERAAEGRRTVVRLSWLDVKLGIRMFGKYPGLSLVTVVGMAVAIAIGAGYFAAFGKLLDSKLPFDDDGRVVVIRTRVLAGQAGLGSGASVYDFEQWRGALTSIGEIGAFREDSRNLITEDGAAHLIDVASMSASGFQLTGVAPIFGRTLLEEDEHLSATPVLVIAHEEWQRRFNSDQGILGRVVRLDETAHTIVGVMPQGFGFPIAYRYWVPLRTAAMDREPGAPVSVNVFGRIAPGFSMADARAEVAALGERMATALPQTHKDVRPQVQPYTRTFVGTEGPEAELAVRGLQFGVALLLLVIAVNVAILVYARTATRTGEITVRTALGASRRRIVTQLFVEALVPAVVSAVVGLGVVAVAFRWLRQYMEGSTDRFPYWIPPSSFSVTPGVILYGLLLATVAAVIIGVLPALKATGKHVQAGLQQFSARGAGMRLGATWTALIVLQVAIAVAALPTAVYRTEAGARVGLRKPSPVAASLLRGRLDISRDGLAGANGAPGADDIARFTSRMTALISSLETEPEVAAVTHALRFPGEEPFIAIEAHADDRRAEGTSTRTSAQTIGSLMNRVAPNFFDVLGVPLLVGRGFNAGDAAPGSKTIIVDQAFATALAGGDNVLGRRVRYARLPTGADPSQDPWFEIVGVVPAFADSLAAAVSMGDPMPRFFHAAAPGDNLPAAVIVKASVGDPAHLSERLRAVAASLDPRLKLEDIVGVAQDFEHARQAFRYVSMGIMAVTASVLLLSAAGIYAMMSFTVAKRRREIGIRAALGADARRVLMGIFGRASAQIGGGVAAGLAMAIGIEQAIPGGLVGGKAHIFLPVVALIMFTVGILAAVGPARRGLAVQPTEALREE